jgi:hypothetical protein
MRGDRLPGPVTGNKYLTLAAYPACVHETHKRILVNRHPCASACVGSLDNVKEFSRIAGSDRETIGSLGYFSTYPSVHLGVNELRVRQVIDGEAEIRRLAESAPVEREPIVELWRARLREEVVAWQQIRQF